MLENTSYELETLEKTVLLAYESNSSINQELKKNAIEYCTSFKETNDGWKVCIEVLYNKNIIHKEYFVQFYYLDVLHTQYITKRYMNINTETIHKSQIHYIRNISSTPITIPPPPHFLLGKLSTVIVSIIREEYPNTWNNVFTLLLDTIILVPTKISIDIFLRIIIALEEDIIQSDTMFSIAESRNYSTNRMKNSTVYQKAKNDATISMRIKDSMRESSLHDIMEVIYLLQYNCYILTMDTPNTTMITTATTDATVAAATTTTTSNTVDTRTPLPITNLLNKLKEMDAISRIDIINKCLDILSKYINWISIEYIVNDRYFPLLYTMLNILDVRQNAVLVLISLFSKKMEYKQRFEIVKNTKILYVLNQYNFSLSYTKYDTMIVDDDTVNILQQDNGEDKNKDNNDDNDEDLEVNQFALLMNKLLGKVSQSILSTFEEYCSDFIVPCNQYIQQINKGIKNKNNLQEKSIFNINENNNDISLQKRQEYSEYIYNLGYNKYMNTLNDINFKEILKECEQNIQNILRQQLQGLCNPYFEIHREQIDSIPIILSYIKLPDLFYEYKDKIFIEIFNTIYKSLKYPLWYKYKDRNSDRCIEYNEYRTILVSKTVKTLFAVDRYKSIMLLCYKFLKQHNTVCELQPNTTQLSRVQLICTTNESLHEMKDMCSRYEYQCPQIEIHSNVVPCPISSSLDRNKNAVTKQPDQEREKKKKNSEIITLHEEQQPKDVYIGYINTICTEEGQKQQYKIKYQEIEVVQYILYIFGEFLPNITLQKLHKTIWCCILIKILTSPITLHNNPQIIECQYINYIRYYHLIEINDNIFKIFIQTFIDERGQLCKDYKSRSTSCYYLLKFLKCFDINQRIIILRSNYFINIYNPIMLLLKERLERGMNRNYICINFQDTIYLCDILSILTSNATLQKDFQQIYSKMMENILQILQEPLYNKDKWKEIDEILASKRFGQFIVILTYLLRGLTYNDIDNDIIKNIVLRCIECIYTIFITFSTHDTIRNQVITFLHTLIDIMKNNCINIYLEFLPIIITTSSTNNLLQTVQLINNFMRRFKEQAQFVLLQIYQPILLKFFKAIVSYDDVLQITQSNMRGAPATATAINTTTTVTTNDTDDDKILTPQYNYEKNNLNLLTAVSQQRTKCLDIYKMLYTFLRDIFCNNMSSVYLDINNQTITTDVLKYIERGLEFTFDPSIIRSCISLFQYFITLWYQDENTIKISSTNTIILPTITNTPICKDDGTCYNPIKNATIRKYILESILPKIVSIPICDTLNHRDPSYTAILRESIKLCRIIYITLQDDVLTRFFYLLQTILYKVPKEYIEAWIVIFNNLNTTLDVLVASLYDLYKMYLSCDVAT